MTTIEVYQSIQTIKEMLVDRGFSATDVDCLNSYQMPEIEAITNAKQQFMIPIDSINVAILFVLSSKARLAEIRKQIENNNTFTGSYILVIKDKMNATDQHKLHEAGDFQLFQLSELQFNISQHELVPKHKIITDETKIKSILENYQLKSKHQLPLILKSDPMARYLNAKPGNIVEIERVSPTCGFNIVYRCCV